MIEAKAESWRVTVNGTGSRKELSAELAGICKAVIESVCNCNPEAAEQMKTTVCGLIQGASVEDRDGTDTVVVSGGENITTFSDDLKRYRVVADMARRARRENDLLREQLGKQTEATRTFDRQDREAVMLVSRHRNGGNAYAAVG